MRTTTKTAIYLLAALMFGTGIVYLSVAYGEGSEIGEGTVDIASKILQGLIVVVSAFALTAIIQEKRQKTLV